MPSFQNNFVKAVSAPCVKDDFLGSSFWCFKNNDVRFGPRCELRTLQHMRVFCVRYQIQMGQLLNTAAFQLLPDVKGVLNYYNKYNAFFTWPSAFPGRETGVIQLTEQVHCNIAKVPYEIFCWRAFRLQQPLGLAMEDGALQYFEKIDFCPRKSELGAVMPRGRSLERRIVEFFAKGRSYNEWGLEIDANGKIKPGQDWGGIVPLRDWQPSDRTPVVS